LSFRRQINLTFGRRAKRPNLAMKAECFQVNRNGNPSDFRVSPTDSWAGRSPRMVKAFLDREVEMAPMLGERLNAAIGEYDHEGHCHVVE
jgi:hypothetical protein